MQALLVFLAVAALSVLASNRRLLEAGRFFQLAQLSASGLLFLVLGTLVGPSTLALLSADDLQRLRPLLALGLGLGGLMIGLHLDPRVLRRLPAQIYAAAVAHSGIAFLVVTAPLALVLFASTRLGVSGAIGAAALLGAAASVSSGHLAVLWSRSGRLDRARGLSVSLLTMLDDVTGIAVLAVALAFGGAAGLGEGAALVGLAILIGLVCGGLMAFLAHGAGRSELMAILIGGVALVSGAAAYLRVSALIAGLCCGALLAVVGGTAVETMFRSLARLERPAYLLLVFLIGAHLNPLHWQAWAILPMFVALRFFGKLQGGKLATRAAGEALRLPPQLGYALLAQGGVSLCVVTDYLMLVTRPSSQLVFSVAVMATIVNEIIASRLFPRSLEEGGPSTDVGKVEGGLA